MNRATLIAGIGGGALALVALAPAVGTARGDLARARGDLARARGDLALARGDAAAARDAAARPVRPAPLLADPGLRVAGGDPDAAARALAKRIRARAAQGGVLVERIAVEPGAPGMLSLRLRLSGPGKAVVALSDEIERGAPLVRLTTWRVVALPGDGLRLNAAAVAIWR